MAGGEGQGGDKERMIYLYHGVSRIFDGYIVGIGLGALLVIILVTIILASDDNVAALIHNFGIFLIIIGVIGSPFTFFFMYRGFTYLAMADRGGRYGIGAFGAICSLALSPALIPEGVLLLVLSISYFIFIVMSVVTIIVGFVFELLMYIALYRLGNYFNMGYLTAGIIISLFATVLSAIPVIEIVGGIIGLIGFVLILVGLNEIKKSLKG